MNTKLSVIMIMVVIATMPAGQAVSLGGEEMRPAGDVKSFFGDGKILPPFSDKGIDLDGNGKYEFLQISVNVSISIRGNFMLSALFEVGGSGIGNQNYSYRFLEKGTHTIIVNLEGRFFGTSGFDGPYNISCVLGAVSLSGTEFLDQYTGFTKGYTSSQFESYPKDVHFSGKLEDATTHSPVQGFVAVMMPNRFVGVTTTDFSGNFTINIPSGLGVIYARDGASKYIDFIRIRRFRENISFTISLYPMQGANANISGRVTNVSGAPISGVKMLFVNYSTGWNTETETDTLGNFSISLSAGEYYIFSSVENFYPNATYLVIQPGENWLNLTLKEANEVKNSTVVFSGWGEISQSFKSVSYGDSLEIRLQSDMLGNLNKDANETEVSNLVEFMLGIEPPLIPEVNSYETFDVDGIFFDPVPGTSDLSIVTSGSVMDPRIPLYMNFSRAYNSNRSIAISKSHTLNLNMSYDSSLTVYLPFGFEMSGSNHSANATVTGKDIITITMLPDPDPMDDISSEWVNILVSASIPGYIAGTITDKKGDLISGAYINATGANTTSDAQGRYNLTLDTGIYSIEVSKPGFATEVATDIVVLPGKTTILDFTLKTVPDSPHGLQATPGDSIVELSWLAPSYDGGSPVIRYNIYRGDSATNLVFLVHTATTTYSDTDVLNGNTYYYAVSAVNSVGEGQKSSVVSAKPTKTEVKPTPPGNLTAIAGNGYVDLSWAPSSTQNVTYSVYRSTTPGSGYALITSNLTGTSYRDSGVENGVTYYYIVKAVTQSGLESDPSNEASATPHGEKVEVDTGVYLWAVIIAGIVVVIFVILIVLLLKARKKPSQSTKTSSEEESKSKKDETTD